MDLIQKKKDVTRGLKRLKAKVQPEDKSAAHIEYGVNVRTQERYLNGEVASLLIGNTLLLFFTARIESRKTKAVG